MSDKKADLFSRPTPLKRGFGLTALAALSLMFATPGRGVGRGLDDPVAGRPVGLVDQPCAPDAFGRSPAEEAFARAVVADGPIDPAVMKAYAVGIAERAKADEARAKTDWADLCRYRAANEALAAGGGAKVVFLGNSITELWRAADPSFFTGGIVDRGISGQTSGQTLLRFYPDVVALHPKAVHILVGTNDLAGNNGPSRPEDLKNNIRAMVDIAKAHHIQVILGSITPAAVIPWRREIKPTDQIIDLNRWMRDFASREGLIYVDYYAVLASPGGGMRDGYSRDGVHPLRTGYALMKPLAEAAIEKALKTAP